MAIAPVVAIECDGELHQAEGHDQEYREHEGGGQRFELNAPFQFVEFTRTPDDGEERRRGEWNWRKRWKKTWA